MDNYLRFIFAIFLPIDSLYFFLGETGTLFFQTFPVPIFFGFLIILINLKKVKKILNDFRIKGFIFLFLYLSFIFFVNLLLTQSNFNLFLESGIRQLISFLFGLVYLIVFVLISKTDYKNFLNGIKLSIFLIFSISLIQFFLMDIRAIGFSSEPSHLAIVISCFLFPCALYFNFKAIYPIMLTVSLFLTLSLSGFIFFSFVILAILFSRFKVSSFLVACFLFFLGLQFINNLEIFSDVELFQYLSSNVELITIATEDLIYGTSFAIDQSGSILDRYWSLAGPVIYSFENINILGYGFGADTIYWDKIFDRDIAAYLAEVKTSGRPQISSHFSKLLLFGGVTGILFFWALFFLSFYRASSKTLFFGFALFSISLFSLAQFHLFIIYFWLAFVGKIYEK